MPYWPGKAIHCHCAVKTQWKGRWWRWWRQTKAATLFRPSGIVGSLPNSTQIWTFLYSTHEMLYRSAIEHAIQERIRAIQLVLYTIFMCYINSCCWGGAWTYHVRSSGGELSYYIPCYIALFYNSITMLWQCYMTVGVLYNKLKPAEAGWS